jgi:hypothetical protein
MKIALFLGIALLIMAVCLGAIGGWLLPQLGVGGILARAIAGGLGGVLIAILYYRLFRRPEAL